MRAGISLDLKQFVSITDNREWRLRSFLCLVALCGSIVLGIASVFSRVVIPLCLLPLLMVLAAKRPSVTLMVALVLVAPLNDPNLQSLTIVSLPAPFSQVNALGMINIILVIYACISGSWTRAFEWRSHPGAYSAIALCGIFLLSLAWSTNSAYGLRLLIGTLASVACYFTVLRFVRDERQFRTFWNILIVSTIIPLTYGIVQWLTGNSRVYEGEWIPRVSSTFEHPNDFGIFIANMLPIVWIGIRQLSKDRPNRLLPSFFRLLLLALMFANLVLTLMRGAWIAVAVEVVLFIVVSERKQSFPLLLAVLVVTPVLAVLGSDLLALRMESAVGNWSSRLEMTTYLWNYFLEQPLWGNGLGSVAKELLASPWYYDPNPHNAYVTILAETGIIGCIAFVGVYLSMVRFAVGAIRSRNSHVRSLGVALFALVLAQAMLDFSESGGTGARLYWWTNAALIIVAIKSARSPTETVTYALPMESNKERTLVK